MANDVNVFAGPSFGLKHRPAATVEARLQLIEDHQDIERLMSLYCLYNDGGWEGQGPSHMGPSERLFTPDGVWDDGGPIGRAEGRAAIRALFDRLRSTLYVSHNVMNPIIDVDGDEARGHWHLIALAKRSDPYGVENVDGAWSLGNYFVDFRRTEEGWRFTSMKVVRGRSMPQRGYNPPPTWSAPDPA